MKQLDKIILGLAAGGAALWFVSRLRTSRFSFKDKTVFITGGSRGLGLVLARSLTNAGARVAICARDERELERAAEDLASLGNTPFTAVADVGSASEVRDAIHGAEDDLGGIDVLINNAGIIAAGPLSTMTRDDFEEALNVSFWGCYNTVEAVLPGMKARQSGRIVNISSIGGKIAIPHLVPYCVGKFALAGYSQGLRAELAQYGITVTTIFPGLMRTGSPRNALFKGQQSAEYGWFKTSDSLPLLTVSAEHAANDILDAVGRGEAERVISLPAQFGVFLNSLCPEITSNMLSLTNRLLPSDENGSDEARPGKEFALPGALSALTVLTDQAAERNNEIDPLDDLT